jgi:hypothetical protein
MESLGSLSDGGSARGSGASGAGAFTGRESRDRAHANHRQRNTIYLFAIHGDARKARHHASPHGVSSSRRQQPHRTIPSELEERGSLGYGISQSEGGARKHRSVSSRVQSRPASPRSRKSHSARGLLGFRSCAEKRGPDCQISGALRLTLPSPFATPCQTCRLSPTNH